MPPDQGRVMLGEPQVAGFILAPDHGSRHGEKPVIGVIHTAEQDCDPGMANNIARYFSTSRPDNPSSPHYTSGVALDAHGALVPDLWQSVHVQDEAWAAPPVNPYSINVEHAARASWGPAEWQTPAAVAMLSGTANLAASICIDYGIALRWLTDAELAQIMLGRRDGSITGWTDHITINRVAKAHGLDHTDHWDPGVNFPVTSWLALAQHSYAIQSDPSRPQQEGFTVTPNDVATIRKIVDDSIAAAQPALVEAAARRAAYLAWNNYGLIDSNGAVVPYQMGLSQILADVPKDAARDAAIAAAIANLPADTDPAPSA